MDTKPEPLTAQQRAETVLTSQGQPTSRYSSLPKELQDALAALCDESGKLATDVRATAKQLMADYFAGQKAVVDTEPKGFTLPKKPIKPPDDVKKQGSAP